MLNEAVDRIVRAVRPERILLFGSQVWGHPNDESDIDLLVVLSTSDQPAYRRAQQIYRSLRGLPLPIEVVVRTQDEMDRAARVPTSLECQALERGMVLHG
ncbi:MAG: nucleotidyltransferase domain-containing protein [Chromatiaceae bacterium]|nr:nucleotidyltransferase domain-containing protein [Chromatiaceae bacterium]